ncbi:MAG: hypothetical protein KDA21_11335, partial [Phycisphaerales bacterium]|nr:hypothetical protein [Phycisphaerales bacterium]
METSDNVASMAKIGLQLKLKALIVAEKKLANRREDDAWREWSEIEGGEPHTYTRLHHLHRQLVEAVGQALREVGRADADANLVRAIRTLEAILREGKGRPYAWFDVPHERHLLGLIAGRPAHVPADEAPGGRYPRGSTDWQVRQEFRRMLATRDSYRARIAEWNGAMQVIRSHAGEQATQTAPAVIIERPTRRVSMSHAAKHWFKMDRRVLKRLVDSGEIV